MKKLFFLVLLTLFFMPAVGDCQSVFAGNFHPLGSKSSVWFDARLITIGISTSGPLGSSRDTDNGIKFQDAYSRALKRAGLDEKLVDLIEFNFVVNADKPWTGIFWFVIREKK